MKTITRVSFGAALLFSAGAVVAATFGKNADPAIIATVVWVIPAAISFGLCAKNGPEW